LFQKHTADLNQWYARGWVPNSRNNNSFGIDFLRRPYVSQIVDWHHSVVIIALLAKRSMVQVRSEACAHAKLTFAMFLCWSSLLLLPAVRVFDSDAVEMHVQTEDQSARSQIITDSLSDLLMILTLCCRQILP
jgi:hypothetical protein